MAWQPATDHTSQKRTKKKMKRLFLYLILLLLCGRISADEANISAKTAGMQKFPGYFPFYWDAKQGKALLEIDKLNKEFLYLDSLPAGIGSNDIGEDRGQLGESRIVTFQRSGPKVLLIQ